MKGNRFSSKLLASALCVLTAGAAAAQTAPEEIADCPERAAGVYHSYEYRPAEAEPVPEGYVPFYISHYGRHGSRYHSSEAHYTAPLVPLREAAAAGTLTAAGRAVLAKGEALAADAERALLAATDEAAARVEDALAADDYAAALAALAALRAPIDAFFEDVLIMDDDLALRENRLRLLNRFVAVFAHVADFGKMAKGAK